MPANTFYNLEWNITWYELAPSLQSLFIGLQNEMQMLQRNYTIMVNRLASYQLQVEENARNILINQNDISILKSDLSALMLEVLNLEDILAGLDLSKIGDLQSILDAIDDLGMQINDLESMINELIAQVNEIKGMMADDRADIDLNTENIEQLRHEVEDNQSLFDNRADIDLNTENIDKLRRYVRDLEAHFRADIDLNLELINSLQYQNDLTDLRADVDFNTYAIDQHHRKIDSHVAHMIQLENEYVDLRADMDLITEMMKKALDVLVDIDFDTLNDIGAVADTMKIDISDLRQDIDLNLELIEDLYKKFEEDVDMRVDVDKNTEDIATLFDMVEHIESYLRADIDLNLEMIYDIQRELSDLDFLRRDVDLNTELHENLRHKVEDRQSLFDNRADIDLNTENIEINRKDIVKLNEEDIDNKDKIDLNLEIIEKNRLRMEELPEEILEMCKEYIDKVRFMNLAPKINYAQEDTVEVYANYTMNNMYKAMMTSDYANEELVYILANSGISTDPKDLYVGYRTSDLQEFTYNAIPANPKFLRNASGDKCSHIDDIMTCDNMYAIVKVEFDSGDSRPNGWYFINTQNTRDFDKWDTGKYLGTIMPTTDIISMKAFIDDDRLLLFSYHPTYQDTKNQYLAQMRVYKLSDLSFLRSYDIINPLTLLYCNTDTTSFGRYSVQSNFMIGDTKDAGIAVDDIVVSGDKKAFSVAFEYIEKDELLIMRVNSMNIPYVPVENVGVTPVQVVIQPSAFKITWDLPKAYIMDGSQSPMCHYTLGDLPTFDYTDHTQSFYKNNKRVSSAIVSYDEMNERFYHTWKDLDTYNMKWDRIYDNGIQKSSIIREEYGEMGTYTPSISINTPDACPWGKALYKYVCAWDRVFLNCASSMYGKTVVMVKQWKRDPADVLMSVPVLGEYFKVDEIGLWNNFGDSSCKTTSGDPRYFNTKAIGNYLVIDEYIGTETAESFEVQKVNFRNIPFNESTVRSQLVTAGIQNPEMDYASYFYNCNSNNIVMFVQDGTKNAGTYAQSDYGFLAVLNMSGSVQNVYSVASTYGTAWNTICNKVQTERNDNDARLKIKCMTFLSSTQATCCLYYDCDHYTNKGFSHHVFTYSGASLSMQDGYEFEENTFMDKMQYGTGVIYSGNTMGLTFQGEKMDSSYQVIFTQKPVISGFARSEMDYLTSNLSRPTLKIQLKTSTGLICYVPAVALFLGGYFTNITNPIPVSLLPNTLNYIYIERNGTTNEIEAYAKDKMYMTSGLRSFAKIMVARVATDSDSVIGDPIYYKVNIGYNDYLWN